MEVSIASETSDTHAFNHIHTFLILAGIVVVSST